MTKKYKSYPKSATPKITAILKLVRYKISFSNFGNTSILLVTALKAYTVPHHPHALLSIKSHRNPQLFLPAPCSLFSEDVY